MSNQANSNSLDKSELREARGWSFLSWRKLARLIALLVLLTIAMLGMGLAGYTGYVLLASEREPEPADAIVVVTGGAGRLEKAIELLKQEKGKRLLISGVHPGYGPITLERRYKLTKNQIACCVDLDSRALNTVANATQTAEWARRYGFESLIIVTSAYHMPRTMLEMRRAAPDIRLQGQLVTRSDRALLTRLFDWNNVHLLTKEYGKLLGAIVYGSSERLTKR
ncbi:MULTISPECIES: YdcF family protein [Cohaesibacter]|uniref:YdcF family protein n=1 Tax=Cohaesibacter TaxID=655352 RepID=UPI000DEA6BA1|nr:MULTISPECIES: YdcF family protein [Cohaesibacter]TLP46812.1 YdcF family protein [Cohaesibacter sp. CAU 1516]